MGTGAGGHLAPNMHMHEQPHKAALRWPAAGPCSPAGSLGLPTRTTGDVTAAKRGVAIGSGTGRQLAGHVAGRALPGAGSAGRHRVAVGAAAACVTPTARQPTCAVLVGAQGLDAEPVEAWGVDAQGLKVGGRAALERARAGVECLQQPPHQGTQADAGHVQGGHPACCCGWPAAVQRAHCCQEQQGEWGATPHTTCEQGGGRAGVPIEHASASPLQAQGMAGSRAGPWQRGGKGNNGPGPRGRPPSPRSLLALMDALCQMRAVPGGSSSANSCGARWGTLLQRLPLCLFEWQRFQRPKTHSALRMGVWAPCMGRARAREMLARVAGTHHAVVERLPHLRFYH